MERETMRVTGGEAVVRTLERLGVEVVFGIPGVHTLAIYDALYSSPIRHVLARHEQGAGFMADGYARVSGKPGVAIVITGPGVTNIATAIGEAYADSSPVVVIASNVEQAWQGQMLGHLHDCKDQLGIMRAVTKWADRARSVEDVPRLLRTAFAEAISGRRRPTHLEVPLDVLHGSGDIELAHLAPLSMERFQPRRSAIELAARMIEEAERVVLYCGGGVVASGATAELGALAERLGAAVITSLQGKGAIPEDHPRCLGNLWEPENAVERVLRESDLVIVIGSKLGAQDTANGRLPFPDRRIRIDIDAQEILRNYPPTLPIVADARETVRALLSELTSRGITKQGWPVDVLQATKREALATAWGAGQAEWLRAIRAVLPRDGILVSDMTMMAYVSNRHYPVYEPGTYLFPTGYGTLGFALPAAIGAKIARPEAAVVALVGDGGYQFTMQELATAVQFRIGIPIILFSDASYTAVKDEQARSFGGRFIAVDLVNPDFQKLATAYGIPSEYVTSPQALEGAIARALERDLPTLIEVPIDFPLSA
jgi:thiamine pyrophosphate-dependent acetolactate synthase large subunit-like protein